MDTFILRIQRQSGGICGLALATEVTIDGGRKKEFRPGDIQEYELERKPVQVRFFNAVPVGKDLEDTFVVTPGANRVVCVTFCYKMNAKYFLPFGAFRYPQFLFDKQIFSELAAAPSSHAMHGAQKASAAASACGSASCQSSPSGKSSQPASSQPDSGAASTSAAGVKFCTQCGAKNPANAKFCISCGNRFGD